MMGLFASALVSTLCATLCSQAICCPAKFPAACCPAATRVEATDVASVPCCTLSADQEVPLEAKKVAPPIPAALISSRPNLPIIAAVLVPKILWLPEPGWRSRDPNPHPARAPPIDANLVVIRTFWKLNKMKTIIAALGLTLVMSAFAGTPVNANQTPAKSAVCSTCCCGDSCTGPATCCCGGACCK